MDEGGLLDSRQQVPSDIALHTWDSLLQHALCEATSEVAWLFPRIGCRGEKKDELAVGTEARQKSPRVSRPSGVHVPHHGVGNDVPNQRVPSGIGEHGLERVLDAPVAMPP